MDSEQLIVKLNHCLQERNRIFPQRDKENDIEVNRELTRFVDEVNSRQNTIFAPDPTLTCKAQSVLDASVFLCGSMKSGTTLLLELLDNHPELLALPGDSYFTGRISKENPPSTPLLHAAWDDWVKRMVNPTGQEPFWLFGTDISPYVVFRQYLQDWYDSLSDSWYSSFISVLLSYYCANPVRPTNAKMWVEKTPGNELKIADILQIFPTARFVHIIRDPRENMASLKRLYATRKWQWQPMGTADALAKSCRAAVDNQARLGRERYHVLSYEALTEEPAERMAELADFLDIQWDESLLRPTVNGMPAHANSMYKDLQVTGVVRKSSKNKWKTVLTEAEQRMACGTLREAKMVGYDWDVSRKDSLLLLLDRARAKFKRT
ncbi:MAG: sulfotransferase [Candidatus Electrothrix sp. AR4]|nr:sulfotransferase [Candidatus Electrothrix sp. AR4]